ncbi:MAG: ATP-binding cassette domain-containing protein [Opitutales bacterium]|nr:ATP-binding cassette domain-containing protein [Opitutales bacterium]MCH8541349.1 ATP-binding cassette domain-containing protein [Opitutales bacterium]
MIKCRSIRYRYARRAPWVLDQFSHSFPAGIHLIKGYSGCGKSTLLRLIGGYLKPAEGGIEIAGYGRPNKRFQKRGLGFVFQQLNLLPLASVRRNLDLAAALAGLGAGERRERAAHILDRLGLSEFHRRMPKTMSGGQQQRATIARALIKEPQVLLLDEPTSGLDDLNTNIIIKVLREFIGEGDRIAIICTHDARLERIADELLDFNRFLPLERHLEALA